MSDEHAETVRDGTAAPAASGRRLGRYTLERELGVGGMGIVYAAFDSELERRVALKVLRQTGSTASQRLLREARAMAKLSHPNVMTVHDAGTIDGRDYVAMELVDGTTLNEWLKTLPRHREVIEAFVAAGRGLAAAHAAGMVHRDFKPHNVMRDQGGRILVTDFGLARSADSSGDVVPARMTPTSWEQLTQTGAIVGTPAYMAPEQWEGEPVTPATDQFAFCVSLWEALAGERPYRGGYDALRAAALEGPAKLDARKVPSGLRSILRRGLMPAATDRWPSMDALLGAIARVRRQRQGMIAAAVSAAAASAIVVGLTRGGGGAPSDVCPAPGFDPEVVWRPQTADEIRRLSPDTAALFDAEVARWQGVRSSVCEGNPKFRSSKLACLDDVMSRLETMTVSIAAAGEHAVPGDVAEGLIDPQICLRDASPPRVGVKRAEVGDAFRALRTARRGETSTPTQSSDPCARVLYRAAALVAKRNRIHEHERSDAVGELRELSQQCPDDPIRSIAAAAAGPPPYDADELTACDAAATVLQQADVTAGCDLLRGEQARHDRRWNDAIVALDRAVAGFTERGRARSVLEAIVAKVTVLELRGRRVDLEAIAGVVAKYRAPALDAAYTAKLDILAARARWRLGDVAGAHAVLGRALEIAPPPFQLVLRAPVDVRGEVVDERGAPVPRAQVIAALMPAADGIALANPIVSYGVVSTVADDRGQFTLPGARGKLVAQAGDRRSSEVPVNATVKLVVLPTSKIAGRVELDAQVATSVYVEVRSANGYAHAPVDASGNFVVERAHRGRTTICARAITGLHKGGCKEIDVEEPVRDLVLAAPRSRRLYVIVRRAGLDRVQVGLYAGEVQSFTARDKGMITFGSAIRADTMAIPDDIGAKLEPKDLVWLVPGPPEGKLTACTLGDPVTCSEIEPTAEAVILPR